MRPARPGELFMAELGILGGSDNKDQSSQLMTGLPLAVLTCNCAPFANII